MHNWNDIKDEGLTGEQKQRVEQQVNVEMAKMTLQELRKDLGLTQEELSELVNLSQPELSRIERSKNPMLSTLRRYVEAIGGKLEVQVVLDNRRVTISEI